MKIPIIFLYFNPNTSLEFFFIIALLIYIVYLQIQLVKKNNILNAFYEKINRPDSKLDKNDILLYLDNLKSQDLSKNDSKDKFLDKKINQFLFENDSKIKLFLHYTSSEKVANKILNEGFQFVDSFYKTAEYVYNDELYLIQRHHEHKQFGDFVMVICISKKIYNHYSEELSKLNVKNIAVEQILTEAPSLMDDNAEEIFLLPKQFIKGYFNFRIGTIVQNKNFNSEYHPSIFKNNINNIESQST